MPRGGLYASVLIFAVRQRRNAELCFCFSALQLRHDAAKLFVHVFNLCFKLPRRHAQSAGARACKLNHSVARCNANGVVFSDFEYQPLDEHIGRFVFLCVCNAQRMIIETLSGIALQFITVKNEYDLVLFVCAIVAAAVSVFCVFHMILRVIFGVPYSVKY